MVEKNLDVFINGVEIKGGQVELLLYVLEFSLEPPPEVLVILLDEVLVDLGYCLLEVLVLAGPIRLIANRNQILQVLLLPAPVELIHYLAVISQRGWPVL